MKRIKFLVASVLFCAMGYVGYTAHAKMTMSEAEKFMKANIEALTLDEPGGGSGGGAYSCTITKQCSAVLPNSTISCTGNFCKSGKEFLNGVYVECDGRRTYC